MKEAEMNLIALDNNDVISTSMPTFTNSFTVSGIDGKKGFQVFGQYGENGGKEFSHNYSYNDEDFTGLVNFLNATVAETDYFLYFKYENERASIEEIAQFEGAGHNEVPQFNGNYMWDAAQQIFTRMQ